jgi:hypothetical protein
MAVQVQEQVNLPAHEIIGRVVVEVTHLPQEDLPLVLDFVEHLKQRQETLRRKALVAEVQAAARRRAKELESVPREQIVARFDQLIEEIRQTAIDNGTAIEGDWESD